MGALADLQGSAGEKDACQQRFPFSARFGDAVQYLLVERSHGGVVLAELHGGLEPYASDWHPMFARKIYPLSSGLGIWVGIVWRGRQQVLFPLLKGVTGIARTTYR